MGFPERFPASYSKPSRQSFRKHSRTVSPRNCPARTTVVRDGIRGADQCRLLPCPRPDSASSKSAATAAPPPHPPPLPSSLSRWLGIHPPIPSIAVTSLGSGLGVGRCDARVVRRWFSYQETFLFPSGPGTDWVLIKYLYNVSQGIFLKICPQILLQFFLGVFLGPG